MPPRPLPPAPARHDPADAMPDVPAVPGPQPIARPRPGRRRQARTPRGHWPLVTLIVVIFALGLLIEGFTHGILGENAADEPTVGPGATLGPASVVNGGPVVAPGGGPGASPISYQIPPKTAALSFDDGPHPTSSPKIL